MSSETKQCQNCHQDFVIEPEDFGFYEKFRVPAPTWCPECRAIRRLAFNNIWRLYKRSCSKCNENIISVHHPDKSLIVYCPKCWWADDWDGREYAMDYDPSRSFLEQVKELIPKTPWQSLEIDYLTMTNSNYTNAVAHLKNCYLTFWADYCENVIYSSFLNRNKDLSDCYRMKDNELCYECVGCHKCYRTFFSEECEACNEVWFSRNCNGCTNCFGCINLKNKQYHIFNEPYSKEEYFKKIEEMSLDRHSSIEKLKNEVHQFWRKHPRRAYTGSTININVTGDYVYESKNAKDAYMVSGAEDCRYIQFLSIAPTRDSYDYSGWGNGAEKIYESGVCGEGVSNIKFSHMCWPDALNIEYSMYAIACKNVFGCVNLKRKEYCILNKEYKKSEYEDLVAKIRESMRRKPYVDKLERAWSYGEFLPTDFSPFAYNETLAHALFPKTEQQAQSEGYDWREPEESRYEINKSVGDLPDSIKSVEDSILSDVIGCSGCGKAYRIIRGELDLLRNFGIPLPRKCPPCRHDVRFSRTNPPKLYDRECNKCKARISTSYSPDRSEIIYCVECYQNETV